MNIKSVVTGFSKTLLLVVLFSSFCYGEEPPLKEKKPQLPDYYPQHFDKVGVFRSLSRANKSLFMDASRYSIKEGARVFLLTSKIASLSHLKSEMIIGLKLDDKRQITEIYVLPPKAHKPS